MLFEQIKQYVCSVCLVLIEQVSLFVLINNIPVRMFEKTHRALRITLYKSHEKIRVLEMCDINKLQSIYRGIPCSYQNLIWNQVATEIWLRRECQWVETLRYFETFLKIINFGERLMRFIGYLQGRTNLCQYNHARHKNLYLWAKIFERLYKINCLFLFSLLSVFRTPLVVCHY